MILCLFLSCEKKVNKINSSNVDSASQGTQNTDTSNTDTSNTQENNNTDTSHCTANGTGSEGSNYFTISDIVAHGAVAGEVQWSSLTDPRYQSPNDQNIFISDSRFNIRILAHPSPGQGLDTYNNSCDFMAQNYQKLQVKVGLKTYGAFTYFATHLFDNISVNNCSEVKEFNIPQSSNPITIDVLEVKWDHSCTLYQQQGISDVPQCPWDYVWKPDCFKISVQLSTDYSRDIPH